MLTRFHAGSIADIAGLRVGHHTLAERPTGCTVVLCEQGAVCGVDVRGASPGTRETDLLDPVNTVEHVHAVLLAGGSAFGLDAASGVMRWLDERGHGLVVGPARVPIVPAAVLFDLWIGDANVRPDAAAGYAACEAAAVGTTLIEQGSIGAGAGATVGKLFGIERAMKGGIGTASVRVHGVTVAALVAVNAIGDVIDCGKVIAGARNGDGTDCIGITEALLRGERPALPTPPGSATTIGIVATDAPLTKSQATKLAQMSHDGLARCIDPVHTVGDGDVMFALATGRIDAVAPLAWLGPIAAEVTWRAVLNGVRAATGWPTLPAADELKGE